jgi:tRNA nucleotidyltransferase (CCA-adding enzyme)
MKNRDAEKIEKKSFLVGGAVRDKLMGLRPRDLDYVVTNSCHDEMLTCGFKQVGKSFPVYLHPNNGCEYVLLRGEDSYSLESDLETRDLTINSMAMDSDGNIIDLFGGQDDLKNKVLRHTSKAFADDPLRILRLARFKTNLEGFVVAPATISLAAKVAASPEFKSISGERVLAELKKAFTSKAPSHFFDFLMKANCLEYIFPEIHNLIDVPQRADYHPEGRCYTHTMLVLDGTRAMTDDFDVLIAALVHDLGKGLTPKEIHPKQIGNEQNGLPLVEEFCSKFKVSNYGRKLSLYVCENHLKLHNIFEIKPSKIFRLLKAGDFRRNPKLIADFVKVCHADSLGKLNKGEYVQGKFFLECQSTTKEAKASDIVDGEINELRLEQAYSKIVSEIKKKYMI